MAGSSRGDSMEEFRGLRITSLDDDYNEEEEEEEGEDIEEIAMDNDEEEIDYVVLGFVEEPKNRRSLLRQFMPSKAGGLPAWLDPVNLPSGKSFLCDMCGEPLQFVLQLYLPNDDMTYTYHRTLFVFICTSLVCLRRDQHEQWKRPSEKPSRSVKVFRCQLPQNNPFYAPQKEDEPTRAGAELCTWCGTWKGIKQCSSCKKALYCSEKHRVRHSQLGHDYDCQRAQIASDSRESSLENSGATPGELPKAACSTIWPEFQIIDEDEDKFDTQTYDDDGGSNSLVSKNGRDDTIMSLMKEFEGDDEKRSWAAFEERISWAPEQVLRCRTDPGAKPLWPMAGGRPSKDDIPPCRYCGGPLCFEFQILPQLLYYFRVSNDVDSLDWATIAVYTCKASCEASVAYKEEYAWVQLA